MYPQVELWPCEPKDVAACVYIEVLVQEHLSVSLRPGEGSHGTETLIRL